MDFKSISDSIIAFTQAHAFWAPFVVGGLAFAECFAFLSLLVPATVILLAISVAFGASGLAFMPLFLAAAIGSILGYGISYFIGLYFAEPIRRTWPFSKNPHLLDKTEKLFQKYGAFAVFLGHFNGPVRAIIPVIAGMTRLAQWKFQVANVSSAFVWAFFMMLPGYIGTTLAPLKPYYDKVLGWFGAA